MAKISFIGSFVARQMEKENSVYLAGKVTGDADYKVRFRAAEIKMLGYGFGWVVNPTKLCRETWSWTRCMAKCLRAEMRCEWVAMLPGWKDSRGARIEHWVAKKTGKLILYIAKL